MGWKAEMLCQGSWSQNGEVWPDPESARRAARDLFNRWMVPSDWRIVEVDEEPNRLTWDEYKNG